ncbi:hypothetical protein ACE6H2_006162 [Prunus campanulata]
MEEIGTSIASQLVEEPVALIRRQLSYLICYDCNIESLKDMLKKLDDKKNDVQRSVDVAKRNGEIIKAQVERWLEDVNKIFSKVQEFENKVNGQRRCLCGLCPSLKSRYSLSRKATKIAQRALDLKLDEGLSNNVANPAPLQQLGSIISSEGFKGFESRKYVMNDVLSALRNEKTRIIGICGMGGVGKTTMVGEIKRLESESIRAPRLHERIKQSKRILIILDDVWSELKLQDVGIPFGDHEGCKILLTSRNEEVCKVMSCKDDIFRVQALNKEEAWELFRATVGESLDNNPDLSHVAKLIVDECKGLPIAIITVGKALLPSNGKHEWNTALHELKYSLPENIPGMEPKMLPNDEFLLKNEHIRFHVSINTSRSHKEEDDLMPGYLFENSLMLYGDVTEYMDIGTVRYLLKQSEDLSLQFTHNLKSLMLLKQSDDQGGFQRLKVLSIMYDKDIEYLMNGTDWTRQHPDKRSFMNLRSIAIRYCCELKYVFSLSVAQNLVQLQSLTVESCHKVEEIISNERMEDDNASHMIKLSRLTILKLSDLPELLGFYTSNQHDSTYEIIKPNNDESVNKLKETRNDNQVAGSTSSKSKVAQVGASCNALFPSNCISWLPNLEELEVVYLRREQQSEDSLTSEQGSKENNEPVVNVVFDLEGHDSAFSQLQTFRVRWLDEEHLWKNVQPGFQGFQNVRSLTIWGCDSLKYVCPYEIYKLLVNLQQVSIYNCENMETIVLAAASTEDSIHEEGEETGGSGAMTLFPKLLINCFILDKLPILERFCPDAYSFAWSFSTRIMEVRNCCKLRTLGFAPVSKKLPTVVAENLSDDHVRGREESGGASSSSSSTRSGCAPLICLQSRPSTRNFTQILPRPVNREVTPANLQTSSASDNLEDLNVEQCDLLEVIFLVHETPSTQAFDKLSELWLWRLPMLSHIWEKGLQVSSGFGNLRFLGVWQCDNLRYLFSLHIAKLLTCLKTIEVSSCGAMEEIVGEAEGGGESIEDELTFPHLNYIKLFCLPKLESFCSQAYTLKLPALEKIEVVDCPKLKAFAPEYLYA